MITFFSYRKWIAFLVSICFIFHAVMPLSAASLSQNQILAKSCAVMDGYNNRILLDKNAYDPMANASTTKIMTCILTLEHADLDNLVLISENASNQPKVRLGLVRGKEYILKDLVYGLMLESFNDCAVAIAEHVAGDVEAFAEMMNDKAEELGCKDTYFVTPNGLDAAKNGKEHHSTAADLCRIMKYCVWESKAAEQFLKITQTLSYECMDPNGQMHLFVNHNNLYANDPHAISGKTGYTAKAGYCYVTAYEEDGLRFCIALLGCGWPEHKDYKWIDSRKIIECVKKEYVVSELQQEKDTFQTPYRVLDGYVGRIDLNKWHQNIEISGSLSENSMEPLKYLHTKQENISMDKKYKKKILAPISKGQKIGCVNYYLGKIKIGSRDIEANQEVHLWNLKKLLYAIILQYF